MGIAKKVATSVAPMAVKAAPELTANVVLEALDRAIRGVGPLPPAAFLCWKELKEADGNVEKAVDSIIRRHLKYAGAQGFVTNLGGLVTAAVTVPANISGLAMIQCRMIACIAHLHGADLEDPRIRSAVLAALMGQKSVKSMRTKGELPGSPRELLALPVDPALERKLAAKVASDLVSQVTGKRLATTVARRVPMIGGAVGLGSDALATWQIGTYAAREFRGRQRE